MDDPFDLARFVAAQDPVWDTVRAELAAGRKRSHWMWFVFPQLAALGRSATARRYGVSGLDEARAYLRHPRLGPRLEEATRLVLAIDDRDPHAIFGTPDDLKFRSSMTLFAAARDAPATAADGFGDGEGSTPSPYRRAIERLCDGVSDPLTIAALGSDGG